jgi:hypothetical protein
VIPAYGLGEGHFRRAIRSGKADGIADLFWPCKKIHIGIFECRQRHAKTRWLQM